MRVWKLFCGLAALALSGAAGSQSTVASAVDPDAVAALQRMSSYLAKLQSFELTSNATLDVVTIDNQRLQIDGVVRYKAKRPGIWIDFDTDLKRRQYFYDGRQFTIYAPKLGYYSTTPAPATNREFLKMVYETFGISLPLEDLFRWADGDESDLKALTRGYNVGTARINGVETDHWAFRQGDFDWEVWIEQGDRPLPRKLVIVDRTETAMPGYSARLDWTLNPPLAASDFTFTPGQNAMRIQMAKLTGTAQ